MRFLLITFLVCCLGLESLSFKVIKQWKQVAFDYPSEEDRQEAIDSGELVVGTAIPIDVDVDIIGAKIFVTVPRVGEGIPYTLATVSNKTYNGDPIIDAFPDRKKQNATDGNCDNIISVYRVKIDECNRMWVIDNGKVGSTEVCPPKLLILNPQTAKIIHQYTFDESLYNNASLFITPVVRIDDDCKKTWVYIADSDGFGLVVYDYSKDEAWRVENDFMRAVPENADYTIGGESFHLEDGIFGMVVDKQNLYFHPLASFSEYSVPRKILDKKCNWKTSKNEALDDQFKEIHMRSSQCAQEAIDQNGNVFCVSFDPITLLTWNVKNPTQIKNIEVDPQLLEFVSGAKVIRGQYGEQLWLVSNRYQKYFLKTLDETEVNFRILANDIYDLLKMAK